MGRGAGFLVGAALAITGPAAGSPLHDLLGAPDDLLIAGSTRLRLEAIDGQFRPGFATSDTMLSLRTTLAVEYHPGAFFVGSEVMDARAYLQSLRSSAATGEVNALELTQAYVGVELGELLAPGSRARVTAGRFTLDLGGRRLVARNQFRNSTNAFTGVLLDWRGTGANRAVAFWTMPHVRLPRDPAGVRANRVELDRESTDLQLMGLSGTHDGVWGGTVELYALGLLERDAPGFPTANRRLFTAGLRLFAPPRLGQFDHDIESPISWARRGRPFCRVTMMSWTCRHGFCMQKSVRRLPGRCRRGWRWAMIMPVATAQIRGLSTVSIRFSARDGLISGQPACLARCNAATCSPHRYGWKWHRGSVSLRCWRGARCGWRVQPTLLPRLWCGIGMGNRGDSRGISWKCGCDIGWFRG